MSCRRATCCLALFPGVSCRGRDVDWDTCNRRFKAPDPGDHALALNGARLPDTCIDSDEDEHQIFIIGDWGGLAGDHETGPVTADHRKEGVHKRDFVDGLDDVAQHRVRDRIRERAALARPQYILNVGDNFYWGGVEAVCGTTRRNTSNFSSQWEDIFESFYTGDGLDGVQWLGVLGNHDYGGYRYSNAWDQAIMYTWKEPGRGRMMRWVTPAQYWRSTVHYKTFSVDYFFLDTNVYDAFEPFDHDHMSSNICGFAFNEDHDCSCEGGPSSLRDCLDWFRQLWEEQLEWLQLHLSNSTADWQIVVTHFPPSFDRALFGNLTVDYGIDLFVTGHLHRQEVHGADDEDNFLAPTVWVVSGGGGGITSDYMPYLEGDVSYGFMHMTLARDRIEVVNVQHTGVNGKRAVVSQRPCVLCSEDDVALNLQVYQEGLQRRGFAGDLRTTSTITSSTTITRTTIATTSSTTSRPRYYLFDDNLHRYDLFTATATSTSSTTGTDTAISSTTFTDTATSSSTFSTSSTMASSHQHFVYHVRRELLRVSDVVENVSSSSSGAASVGAAIALTAVLILWLRGGIWPHFVRAEALESQTPPAGDPSALGRAPGLSDYDGLDAGEEDCKGGSPLIQQDF